MKKILLFFIVLICSCAVVQAQLKFHFVPEVNARTVDGLSAFQVQNLSASRYDGQVSITVRETSLNQPVVTILTPVLSFTTGNTPFPVTAFRSSIFNFAGNALGSLVNQTRNFPPGEYSFCFRFIPSDKMSNDDFEDCYETTVQPLLPISLLLPSDQDTICQKRPLLSWQPPMPYHNSMRFRLLLTEKREGETASESILKNAPLLLLDQIAGLAVNYPSNYPELKEGKTYCWQVAAYQTGLIISTSEVWEFTVQCKEPDMPAPNDSYRDLKVLSSGNYYIANRFLKFAFSNNYNVTKLSYAIYDMSNGRRPLKDLPEVRLTNGLNKVDIDLSDLDLMPGKQYLLKVSPFGEAAVEVKFVYQDKD